MMTGSTAGDRAVPPLASGELSLSYKLLADSRVYCGVNGIHWSNILPRRSSQTVGCQVPSTKKASRSPGQDGIGAIDFYERLRVVTAEVKMRAGR
jgi:hypothetical protein